MAVLQTSSGIALLSEENYETQMKTVAEPYLAERRIDSWFEGVGGGRLHYEAYCPEEARGAVVISHGFTESAEKFREMSYYYLQAGYRVFALDHRGHGYSCRDNEGGDPSVVHQVDFDTYINDLHLFMETVVKPAAGKLPLFLYGHSMGGAIAVLYLMRHPEVFEKAVLTAPMISPNTAGIPHAVTGAIANVAVRLGKGAEPALGTGAFDPHRTFENSNDTSRARFEYYHAKRCADVHYQTSRPSYAWVQQSLKIVKTMLKPENCKKIRAKALLCQAETDGSVVMPPQNLFISRVPGGKFKKFYGSKHEIYMSTNDVMQSYLDTVLGFLADR